MLRRRCRSAGSSIIAAGIQDKKGENAEIFKKLHIDDCHVELKLKKRCSLFLKAYGFYKNIPIASGAPLSVSAGILSGMPPCARWLKSCSARAAAADE